MSGAILRPARVSDLSTILSVEAACRSVSWSHDNFLLELSDENALCLIAQTDEREVCGYILSRCAADECTIHTLGVLPTCRRQGVGTALVQALAEAAVRRNVATLFLEVRAQNTGARVFYATCGFARCGTRKAYYADDNDDAIIMTRVLARPLNLST